MPKAFQIFVYCLLLVFAFSLSASISDAKNFSWKDESGKAHFTDDPAKIPPKYRKGKKKGLHTIKEAPPAVLNGPGSGSNHPVSRLGFAREYRVPLIPTESGNFIVETTLNGNVKANLMLDTGASLVSFTPKVGEKRGRTRSLNSAQIPFQIANGVVWNQLLALDKVRMLIRWKRVSAKECQV